MAASLSSFKNAAFVTVDNDNIDINDENFWEKAIGIAPPPVTDPKLKGTLQDLVGNDKKRARRQAEVFDPFADMVDAENRKEMKKRIRLEEELANQKLNKKATRVAQRKAIADRKEKER